ncbi:MAG: nucleoside monophosphate kinase [bacterium]|nr:nucleoside monophosphate kinase [bacterium]
MSDIQNVPTVLLFGYPGCGKGTQGVVLGGMANLIHLAMGDIFRALDKESDIGREFLSYSTKGLLVPDELTIRVWTHHVVRLKEAGKFDPGYHVLLLDGIPRTPPQVELMRDLIDVRKIVHLVIENEQALIDRLSGRAKKQNRPDDADPEVIRKRIAVYRQETTPVLEAYNASLVANINADQHPLAVLHDIAGLLASVVPGNI